MKRSCGVFGAMLACTTVLVAQQSGSVTGSVICGDTGAPAARAPVFLQAAATRGRAEFPMPGEVFHATTDADGAFTISSVKPGEYYVVAQYPGYISARDYIFPGAFSPEITGRREAPADFVRRVTVSPGDAVTVSIRLRRGGSISGRVTYSDGAAIAGMGLTAKIKLERGDFTDVLAGGAAQSDSAGNYRIEGLADGTYVVLGGLLGDMVPVFGGARRGRNSVVMLAGGGLRPSKARTATVQGANEVNGVDLMVPREGRRVRGSVTAPDGHRLNDGLVRLAPTGEPRFSIATPIDAEGFFEFTDIWPDSYRVTVENAADLKEGPAIAQRYQAAPVEIRVGDADVEVKVPAAPIR